MLLFFFGNLCRPARAIYFFLSNAKESSLNIIKNAKKGEPVYQGNPKIRGRAAEKLVQSMPVEPQNTFTECPYENLRDPGRVHLDAFGNIHLCQGLSMGNIWETPLSRLVNDYDPAAFRSFLALYECFACASFNALGGSLFINRPVDT